MGAINDFHYLQQRRLCPSDRLVSKIGKLQIIENLVPKMVNYPKEKVFPNLLYRGVRSGPKVMVFGGFGL